MNMKLILLTFALITTACARPNPDVSHIYGDSHHTGLNSYGASTSSVNRNYEVIDHNPHSYHIPSGHILPPVLDYHRPQPPIKEPNGFFEKDLFNVADAITRHSEDEHPLQDVTSTQQVYFYAAPNEPEEPQFLRIQFIPARTKNTNVIFVKAPTPGPIVPQVIASKDHVHEDKTKVYVFVKQPDDDKTIALPLPPSVKTKPDVYIVKYKNQDEARKVIAAGVENHDVGSTVYNLKNEHAFVNTFNNGVDNINTQYGPNLENDIRFGARSISSGAIDVRVNDEAGTHIQPKEKVNSEDSGTLNTSSQENSENASQGPDFDSQSHVVNGSVKKNTIQSLEEEFNTSGVDGVKVSSDSSSGTLSASQIPSEDGTPTSKASALDTRHS